MSEIIEICGYKGNSRWVRLGHHFYVAKRNKGRKTTFRCGSGDCRAGFVATCGVPGPLNSLHNHEPQPWIALRNQMFQNLKRRSMEEVTRLLQIYEEEAERFADAAPYLLYRNVVASMRKWRRSALPPVPRSVEEFGEALSAIEASTPDTPHIYHATVRAQNATANGYEYAVILAMPGWQDIVCNAGTLVFDGTFQTVPAGTGAAQLLTVHSVVGQAIYHPIVVLMDSRRRVLYEEVLTVIWRDASVGTTPRPTAIVTDYEPALQAAVRRVTGHTVSGCYFHYLQALTRKARQCGVVVRRDNVGGRLVHLYGTIALLPPALAAPALAAVREIALGEGLPFREHLHTYFETYWMGQIGPERFSAYGRQHRTSNAAESYHSYLQRALSSSPNVWIFVGTLRRKFNTCAARRSAQIEGRDVPSHRNRARSLVRINIVLDNVAALERGQTTLRDCLSASSRAVRISSSLVLEPMEDVPEVGGEVELVDSSESMTSRDTTHITTPAAAPGILRCGVCLENQVQRALYPCGHLLCGDCVTGIETSDSGNRCAFCRAFIANTLAIFF